MCKIEKKVAFPFFRVWAPVLSPLRCLFFACRSSCTLELWSILNSGDSDEVYGNLQSNAKTAKEMGTVGIYILHECFTGKGTPGRLRFAGH